MEITLRKKRYCANYFSGVRHTFNTLAKNKQNWIKRKYYILFLVTEDMVLHVTI